MSSDNEVLIEVSNVSKKFCRSLKRSLYYGAQDILDTISPFSNTRAKHLHGSLRKDEFWAVRDVSFSLRRGECLGLIGHNGAGKSTLLKILNGLIKPDQGKIVMRGRVNALIELNAGFNGILSGRENIYNQGALLGMSNAEINKKLDAIIAFSEIGEFIDMPVQNYSSGMRVRLGFAIAAQMEPDILIIDEVLAVGDVAFRMKSLNAISEKMRNTAVIFVSHSMPQVFRVCNEVLVMNHGGVEYYDHNVAAGVDVYLSLLQNVDAQISGHGIFSLDGCEIFQGDTRAGMGGTIHINHSDGLTIRATIRIHRDIGPFRIQFVAWNSEMLPAMDVMDQELSGFLVDAQGREVVTVEAHIPTLDLNSGKYMLSLHLNSADLKETHLRHDSFAFFVVGAPAASSAITLKRANWQVIKEPQPSK